MVGKRKGARKRREAGLFKPNLHEQNQGLSTVPSNAGGARGGWKEEGKGVADYE